MRGTLSGFAVLVMVAMGLSSGANAADMVPAYLHGHWALGTSEQACDAPDVEYFIRSCAAVHRVRHHDHGAWLSDRGAGFFGRFVCGWHDSRTRCRRRGTA